MIVHNIIMCREGEEDEEVETEYVVVAEEAHSLGSAYSFPISLHQ